ncbi:hypothetical protein ABT369_34065 [Dactylosporangium sp. NPDC000244]|uniref:hypothetical protein n=1 Tax=Dactylosporangium sp. NPDC000244 TaxID=3154365 RepID=UPI003320F3A7
MEQLELAVAHGSVAVFTKPSRTVGSRAEIRERASVAGAPRVSEGEETVAIIARPGAEPATEQAPKAEEQARKAEE